jgi:hypothetical protein
MLIESTIHVHKSTMETLNKGVVITGRTRTYIIKMLMQRVMRDNQKFIKSYSRVKYQERDLKENWNSIHVSLNEYEYEYYLDMRKFYKMSVSYILAYAAMRYMDEILNEFYKRGNSTDNYFYKNYVFIKKIINKVICWQIYWGIPSHL